MLMRNVQLYKLSHLILSTKNWQEDHLAETQSDKTDVALTESWCSWVSNESDPLLNAAMANTSNSSFSHHISPGQVLLRLYMLLPHLRLDRHFKSTMDSIWDYLQVVERGGSSLSHRQHAASLPKPTLATKLLLGKVQRGNVDRKAVNGLIISLLESNFSSSLSMMLTALITIQFK